MTPTYLKPTLIRHLAAAGRPTPSGRAHVCAASGLVAIGERCFAVADDELYLTAFNRVPHSPLEFVRLLPGELAQDAKARKAEKPDFEVLLHVQPSGFGAGHQTSALLALGSGSDKRRNTGVLLTFKSADVALQACGAQLSDLFSAVRAVDLKPLYDALEPWLEEINIEGAAVVGGCLKLLQRDNTADHHAQGSCRVVEYDLVSFLTWLGRGDEHGQGQGQTAEVPLPIKVQRLNLGLAHGVPLAPTDAAPISEQLWVMSAVAEDCENSVLDGPCTGSAVVLLNAANEVLATYRLEGSPKIEGIAAQVMGGEVLLTLVTDADDPSRPSELLQVRVPIPLI